MARTDECSKLSRDGDLRLRKTCRTQPTFQNVTYHRRVRICTMGARQLQERSWVREHVAWTRQCQHTCPHRNHRNGKSKPEIALPSRRDTAAAAARYCGADCCVYGRRRCREDSANTGTFHRLKETSLIHLMHLEPRAIRDVTGMYSCVCRLRQQAILQRQNKRKPMQQPETTPRMITAAGACLSLSLHRAVPAAGRVPS